MTNRVIDLSTKPLSGLNDEEIVYLHVAGRSQEYTKDFIVISVLREINRNMKHTSGFNNSKTFAPALCAFAILDQIGSCYEDAAMAPYAGDEVNIKRALYYFCGIASSSPEAEYLYMLRNSMVHDASMVSHNKPKTKWYFFRYRTNLGQLIKTPSAAWDGQAATIGNGTTAYVDPDELVTATETAVNKLGEIFVDRRSDLKLRVPKTEILHKYLMWDRR